MVMIYVKNDGKNPLPCAGRLIPPGEGLSIDEKEAPPHLRPQQAAPEQQPPQDPILALINGKVPEIADALPALSDGDLMKLKEAEEDGKNRLGVMKAVAEEELRRADVKAVGGGPAGDDADSEDDDAAGGDADLEDDDADPDGADTEGSEEG